MKSLNQVQLIGNVGADPEMKFTPAGKAVCNFSLCTSEKWEKDGKKTEKATWHRIVTWDKLAETVNEYVQKGKPVFVQGRIDNRSYEKDGQTVYVSEVVADQVIFLSGPSDKTPAAAA